MRSNSTSSGLLGAAVIDGRVTDLLDAPGVIASVIPELFTESALA